MKVKVAVLTSSSEQIHYIHRNVWKLQKFQWITQNVLEQTNTAAVNLCRPSEVTLKQLKAKPVEEKKTTDTARTEGTKTCHAAARGGKRRWKELSLAIDSSISWTTLREQILYLFDIVASLCAGFNEHDIQFLSSLLALLRGDLSAQVEAERGGRRTNRQMWKETQKRTGQKEREEVERETKRAQHRILFWVKKREREVSLVITHGHRGRQKGEKLLCWVKMKQQEKKNRISFIPQPHSDPYIMNTWRGY